MPEELNIPLKHDTGKPDWSLVPFESLEGMVRVLEFGKKKYAAWNFAEGKGLGKVRLISAALRHLFSYLRGEDNDPESGLSHVYHAQCCLLFLAYYNLKPDIYPDDRPTK